MIFAIIIFSLSIAFVDGQAPEVIKLSSGQCNPTIQDCGGCSTTVRGCICLEQWSYQGKIYNGCANPTNDQRGDWCEYKLNTCKQSYDYCKNPDCSGSYTPPINQSPSSQKDMDVDVYAQCELLDDQDFFGGDLFSPGVIADSVQSCIKLCDLVINCKYFTYNKLSGRCWLKQAPKGLKQNDNHITGLRCTP